jgi:PAS domain S-box-containing protein
MSDKDGVTVKTIAQSGLNDFSDKLLLSDLPEIQREGYFVCNNLRLHQSGNWASDAVVHGFLSMASFPVKIGNSTVAVLTLYSDREDVFGEEEILAIEKLREVIADALVRIRLDEHRKHAQMDLERREAIYSRVAEKMVGTLCEINAEGRLTFVGESQKQLLGYESEVLLGKSLAGFIHPDSQIVLESTLKKLAKSHAAEIAEVRIKRCNGEYSWVELIADSLTDDKGAVSGSVIALRDISDRKKVAEQLERHVHDLEERVRERTERIKTLDERARKRVSHAINQINSISQLRERLRREPGFESGFELIVRRAIRDLGMDAGGVFVLNHATHKVETKAFAPSRKSIIQISYPQEDPFIEFETLNNKEPFSRNAVGLRTVLGTDTVHCAPISVSGRVRGILALGADGTRSLDENELSIIKLYSALVTTLLKSTNLNVEPARELIRPMHAQRRVEFGNSYLVPDNVALAYELFLEAIMSGTEGLCITRTAPARVRERYKLHRTPVIWLTDEVVEGEKVIHSLQDLSILVSNYVQKATKPVILIDGIEYLISHKGFESVYHLMQSKRTQMEAHQGILIVPFFHDAVEAKEAKLMEREFTVFDTTHETSSMTKDGVPAKVQPNDFY